MMGLEEHFHHANSNIPGCCHFFNGKHRETLETPVGGSGAPESWRGSKCWRLTEHCGC